MPKEDQQDGHAPKEIDSKGSGRRHEGILTGVRFFIDDDLPLRASMSIPDFTIDGRYSRIMDHTPAQSLIDI